MRLLNVIAALGVFSSQLVLANTETYLMSIPYYYNILPHPQLFIDYKQHTLKRLNETHLVLEEFPIYNTLTYGKYNNHIIISPDAMSPDEPSVLLVKVNNYENNAFSSDNVIYWKLCWPATSPYLFRISHRFTGEDLALYLVVQYQFDGIPNKQTRGKERDNLHFLLYATALRQWLPLPVELITIIAYLVDIGILLYSIVPGIVSSYFE